jgi:hypothetical protein
LKVVKALNSASFAGGVAKSFADAEDLRPLVHSVTFAPSPVQVSHDGGVVLPLPPVLMATLDTGACLEDMMTIASIVLWLQTGFCAFGCYIISLLKR